MRTMPPSTRGLAALVLALALASAGHATTRWTELPLPGGQTLRYALVVPSDFDEHRAYPVLLALPPGPQDERMVQAGLLRYWGEQAAERGWVVVSPMAVEGKTFFQGSEDHIPALLEHLRSVFQVEGDGFHLAGASNGGRSAFRIALRDPTAFLSLMATPGYPPSDQDHQQLADLVEIPIHLAVGGEDQEWVRVMRKTETRLRELGGDVYLEVFEGEGHVPVSLDEGAFLDRLETLRGSVRQSEDRQIAAVLDDFHAAASRADGERYFELLTPDAVFLGTDPEERWTLEEFRAFAKPYFDDGQGWTYTATSRHVTVAEGGAIAWFDEELDNESYGHCRGSGVLVKGDGVWRITQYNLSIPIPNALSAEIVARMRESAAPGDEGEPPP
jgi:ketosteroid isomerase-like protein